jgi:hypothetical protein
MGSKPQKIHDKKCLQIFATLCTQKNYNALVDGNQTAYLVRNEDGRAILPEKVAGGLGQPPEKEPKVLSKGLLC